MDHFLCLTTMVLVNAAESHISKYIFLNLQPLIQQPFETTMALNEGTYDLDPKLWPWWYPNSCMTKFGRLAACTHIKLYGRCSSPHLPVFFSE